MELKRRLPQVDLMALDFKSADLAKLLAEALQGVEVVFHCACILTRLDGGFTMEDAHLNFEMTRALLEACAAAAVKLVVNVSSAGAVYCRPDTYDLFATEETWSSEEHCIARR